MSETIIDLETESRNGLKIPKRPKVKHGAFQIYNGGGQGQEHRVSGTDAESPRFRDACLLHADAQTPLENWGVETLSRRDFIRTSPSGMCPTTGHCV